MNDINFLSMAENYSAILSFKYRKAIHDFDVYNYKKSYSESDNNPPFSILGFITVGLIKFTISVIVNFIKYIIWTIKELLRTSEVLKKILQSLYNFFEESFGIYNIKVTDPKELDDKLRNIYNVITKRYKYMDKNSMFGNDNILDKFKIVYPEEIINKNYFTDRYVDDCIVDESKLNYMILDINEYFKKSIDKFKNDSKSTKTINVRDKRDLNDAIMKYKNTIESITEVSNTLITYLESVNNTCEVAKKKMNKLMTKPDNATDNDKVFIKLVEGTLGMVVLEQKSIIDNFIWIKDEVIYGLMTLGDKI